MAADALASEPIQRRSLHDELVDRLRNLITVGELAAGERVPERELCIRFGVSRTPMREALKVLASEGVVTLRLNRGAVVNGLTVEELANVFPVMGALEALAGEIACKMITDAELIKIRTTHELMVSHWQRGELQPYFWLNQAVHGYILEATRNEVLISTYRSLSRRILAARYLANMSPERWAQAVREHELILDALEKRDGARLASILKAHLANKLEAIENNLKSQPKPSRQSAR